MTTITAKIIADSISPDKIRLTTMQLRYPRFIHAELMTHRVFSRNASSSRAVPVEKLIEDIKRDPAMPIHWGKNQKGMQAHEECDATVRIHDYHMLKGDYKAEDRGVIITDKIGAWYDAMHKAIHVAEAFNEAGYHKQIVNRLLEPFSHINVLVSSTYWANWFALRDHPDAMPEICKLAQEMKKAMDESKPFPMAYGSWHLPYVYETDYRKIGDYLTDNVCNVETIQNEAIKISVARCARVSYLTNDMKEPHIENDLKLYWRLVGAEPLHASPAEHQATPDKKVWWSGSGCWEYEYEHGNFWGWRQYRKMLKGEFVDDYAKNI